MSEQSFPLPIEELIAHEGFLRSLAKGLLFDDAQVDDAVQEAWIAAMQTPPRDRSNLRSWLGVVTRNQALKMRDRERRLLNREQGSAKDEATESVTGFLEKESLRREVVDAVMKLEEPYRETILLRHFENLSPRAIAKQKGVPVPTIYTRNKRALEMLRARLDQKYGGDRRAWALGLIPIAAQGAKTLSLAAVGLLAASVFLFAGTATFFFIHSQEKVPSSGAISVASSTPMPGNESLLDPRVAVAREARIPIGNPEESLRADAKPVEEQEENLTAWTLHGHLRDLKGNPLPAKMPWPWAWAEGEGFTYFRLEALLDMSELPPNLPPGSSNTYTGTGRLGFLKPLPQEDLRAAFQREIETRTLSLEGSFAISNYDETDGSFSVEVPESYRGNKIYVQFQAEGAEKRSESIPFGEAREISFAVDLDAIQARWAFFEFTTLALGTRSPVYVDDLQCRKSSLTDYLLPSSGCGILWIARPGHCGVAGSTGEEPDTVLFASGYGSVVAENVELIGGEIGGPSEILFEKESRLRVKLLSASGSIHSTVRFQLENLKGQPLWAGNSDPGSDGVCALYGLPSGELRLRATWENFPQTAVGSLQILSHPGEELSVVIPVSSSGERNFQVHITTVPGETHQHRFEIVLGEKTLSLPSIVLDGGNSGTVGISGPMPQGNYKVVWYVDDKKQAEKFVKIGDEQDIEISFP